MRIQIAQPLRPFSHLPGASCLLPGTLWKVTAFPTLIHIHPLEGKGNIEISLKLTGPVDDFTLLLDLEKSSVWVYGYAKEGFFRLELKAKKEGLFIRAHKIPKGGLETSEGLLLAKGEFKWAVEWTHFEPAAFEDLSLGSHKKQDWDFLLHRFDLKEILPQIFRLGQQVPFLPEQPLQGTAKLLASAKEAVEKKKRTEIEDHLKALILAGFGKLMVPRLLDNQYQGLIPEESIEEGSSAGYILQETRKIIRSLIVEQNERRLSLLPCLPVSFDAGRMVNVQCDGIGRIDLEWSKKQLKKVLIEPSASGEILLLLPRGGDSFRIRKSLRERGKTHLAKLPLLLKENERLFLDRFQK